MPEINASTSDSLVRDIEQVKSKKCFVIMPFGEKPDVARGTTINFDDIYENIIKPAAEGTLRLDCKRSDEEQGPGLIHKTMVERILSSDVAIVDITTLNPNVFYELGVRHTARRNGTILIRRKGDHIPFNINGMRAFEYEYDPTARDSETNKRSRETLVAVLRAALLDRQVDSLVHSLVPRLNVSVRATPFLTRETFVWRSRSIRSKEFAVVRGHIRQIDSIDVWVNPENTKMQMGRHHDDSISACIRYYGASRNRSGHVVTDRIVTELQKKLGKRPVVEPGTAILTGPGSLSKSNNVRAVVHVAAQHGEPGNGYVTVRGYAECLMNTLDLIAEFNESWLTRLGLRKPLKSVLFPLLGTRGDRDPQEVADKLVRAARDHLELWPDCGIDRVAFLAYTDRDDELCQVAFKRMGLEYVPLESEEQSLKA